MRKKERLNAPPAISPFLCYRLILTDVNPGQLLAIPKCVKTFRMRRHALVARHMIKKRKNVRVKSENRPDPVAKMIASAAFIGI